MITVKKFAEWIEENLNNGLRSVFGNDEIQFVIWANAGEYQKPVRNGNRVYYDLVGDLHLVTASNGAIPVLVMGVNQFVLDFLIPIEPPRTNAKQTEEDLTAIADNDYVFVTKIVDIVNSFFNTPATLKLEDGEGNPYTVGLSSASTSPGAVGSFAGVGLAVPFRVYIDVTFVQNGINSRNVSVNIDGATVNVPYQALRLGRSGVTDREVFSGDKVSTCFDSSTALSVDIDCPAADLDGQVPALDYLINGEPNMAHFVTIGIGESSKTFFMSITAAQGTVQGVANVGLSATFTELSGRLFRYNVPPELTVWKFKFENSTAGQTITLPPGFEGRVFISGLGVFTSPQGAVELPEAAYEWDEEGKCYYVYLVGDRAFKSAAQTTPPHEVLQQGEN